MILPFLTITSIFLFSYEQTLFNLASEIDAERFADFAIFVSAFFSLITIILLFHTYQQTRDTHKVTIDTFEQTKKDSIGNTFFNLIQNYHAIVDHLHNRITLSLQIEYVELNEKCGNRYGENRDKENA